MNNPFEIKVCGINDEISMNTALKCKADYVGLVFYPNSPRNVSINLSRELLQLRNKITKIVALIVDPYDDFLFEIKKKLNLTIFNFMEMKIQTGVWILKKNLIFL